MVATLSYGQDYPPITVDLYSEGEFIIDNSRLHVIESQGCSLSIFEAMNSTWLQPGKEYFNSETDGCHWVKVSVRFSDASDSLSSGKMALSNVRPSTLRSIGKAKPQWIVEAGHHGLNTMFIVKDNVLLDSLTMGNDLPVNQRAYPHVWSKSYLNIAPVNLESNTDYQLFFKYLNSRGQTLYGTNDELAITFIPLAFIDQDSRVHLISSGLMMGGLLLLFLYQLTQWMVYRTELGITYCFMLLGLMSYIMYDDFLLHAIFADQLVSELWLFVTGSLGLLGFFRFAQLTLQAVDFKKGRDRILELLVKAKFVELLVYTFFALFASSFWSPKIASFVPEMFRVLLMITLLIFSWAVISHFRENKDAATRAFMYGNLSLVIGVMIVTTQVYILPYAHIVPVQWYLNLIWPVFDYIIEAGIVGMALCFAFAVAMLTKEREVKIERGYNRRLVDVEMKALRAQMNPHFLFNGLNSIKSFVIDNKRYEASEYLTKFARLIRRVLENSKASLIPLSRELETLDYYIEMESMRFTDRFSYAIHVEEGIDTRTIEVPPTLIQPFVENSIWHGLLPLEDQDARVEVYVAKDPAGGIKISIEDNGIGREAASGRKANVPNKGKSLGMEITAERIAMLKELYGFSAELDFIDLYDELGKANGTRVVITIEENE